VLNFLSILSIVLFNRSRLTGPGAGVDNLLLESGTSDHFLLESGTSDVLLLE
jgi:hypothetical protein